MPTTTRRGSNVEAKAFFRRQPAQEQTLGVGQDRYKKRVVGKGFDRYFFWVRPCGENTRRVRRFFWTS